MSFTKKIQKKCSILDSYWICIHPKNEKPRFIAGNKRKLEVELPHDRPSANLQSNCVVASESFPYSGPVQEKNAIFGVNQLLGRVQVSGLVKMAKTSYRKKYNL